MKIHTLLIVALMQMHIGLYAQSDGDQVRAIFENALQRGQAYANLRELCLDIGPRLSGSPQAAAAVEWSRQLLIDIGADTVYLQPVMVPHWQRGVVEEARMVSSLYGSRQLNVCSIGNTEGTGTAGVLAEVIEVGSREQLHDLGKEGLLREKIVFYNVAMDQRPVHSGSAYGKAAWIRSQGAHLAEGHGAVGVIIRSLGIELDDYPHTGSVTGALPTPGIPALAASTRDAEVLSAWLLRDPGLKLYLANDCRMLPEVLSYNVVGEIRGSEMPEDIILVGAHLDSWDMGHGAHDDGTGVVQSAEVLRIFRQLDIAPRHTLRVVLFMNEENGMRGSNAYAAAVEQQSEKHVLAIESDAGGFAPRGFNIDAGEEQVSAIQMWAPFFSPYLIHWLEPGFSGADIAQLKKQGIPVLGLRVDPQRYFGYHHSALDTFDKVNRRELHLGAAAMASMVYLVDRHGLPSDKVPRLTGD